MTTEREVHAKLSRLRKEADQLKAEGRRLNDQAKDAGRDFTASERAKWDTLTARLRELRDEIQAGEGLLIATEKNSPQARVKKWKQDFFRTPA